MKFVIRPLVGVGPVEFNMARASVYAALGDPEYRNGNRECFLSGLMIDFDEAGTVEFIEMARSEKFFADFDGQNLHGITANDAVALISKYSELQEDDAEAGYSYIYPKLQISLWRSILPENVSDENGKYFEAIGAARDGYFDA